MHWCRGELNEWSKKTNTELATHIPLLIRVPWIKSSVGARTKVKVELVDLYRTLAGLAGLDENTIEPSVQGVNLAPVFDSPNDPPEQFKTKRAFSQIGRCNCGIYATRDGPTQECGGNACCQIPITCPPNSDPEVCDRDTNSSHWTMNSVGTYDYMGKPQKSLEIGHICNADLFPHTLIFSMRTSSLIQLSAQDTQCGPLPSGSLYGSRSMTTLRAPFGLT